MTNIDVDARTNPFCEQAQRYLERGEVRDVSFRDLEITNVFIGKTVFTSYPSNFGDLYPTKITAITTDASFNSGYAIKATLSPHYLDLKWFKEKTTNKTQTFTNEDNLALENNTIYNYKLDIVLGECEGRKSKITKYFVDRENLNRYWDMVLAFYLESEREGLDFPSVSISAFKLKLSDTSRTWENIYD